MIKNELWINISDWDHFKIMPFYTRTREHFFIFLSNQVLLWNGDFCTKKVAKKSQYGVLVSILQSLIGQT